MFVPALKLKLPQIIFVTSMFSFKLYSVVAYISGETINLLNNLAALLLDRRTFIFLLKSQHSHSYLTQFIVRLWKELWSYWYNPLYIIKRFLFNENHDPTGQMGLNAMVQLTMSYPLICLWSPYFFFFFLNEKNKKTIAT